jgi:hypothetical protein
MDYEKYYNDQIEFPTYRGVRYQRGQGLGGVFRKLFRWIAPIIKQHGAPILKSVGESGIQGLTNFAKDALEGKDIKQSAQDRFTETIDDLKKKATMKGNGIKRKKLIRKLKKIRKRKLDIFD